MLFGVVLLPLLPVEEGTVLLLTLLPCRLCWYQQEELPSTTAALCFAFGLSGKALAKCKRFYRETSHLSKDLFLYPVGP